MKTIAAAVLQMLLAQVAFPCDLLTLKFCNSWQIGEISLLIEVWFWQTLSGLFSCNRKKGWFREFQTYYLILSFDIQGVFFMSIILIFFLEKKYVLANQANLATNVIRGQFKSYCTLCCICMTAHPEACQWVLKATDYSAHFLSFQETIQQIWL